MSNLLINSIDEQNILYTDVRSVLMPYLLTHIPKRECEIMQDFLDEYSEIAEPDRQEDVCRFYITNWIRCEFEIRRHFEDPNNLVHFYEVGGTDFAQYMLSNFDFRVANYYAENMEEIHQDLEQMVYEAYGTDSEESSDSESE